MSIELVEYDNTPFIEYRIWIMLSNGICGKQIIIDLFISIYFTQILLNRKRIITVNNNLTQVLPQPFLFLVSESNLQYLLPNIR